MVGMNCQCGRIGLEIHNTAKGSRLKCGCNSCRGFSKFMAETDRLDDFGAVEIFQTIPSNVSIAKGVDQMAAYSISDQGLYRWYCQSCRTHMANSLAATKLPFIGLPLRGADRGPEGLPELGKSMGYANCKYLPEKQPRKRISLLRPGLKILGRSIGAPKASDWQKNGNWIVNAVVLTSDQRRDLYSLAKTI